MASLAGLLHARGLRVTGSDEGLYPPMSTALERWGERLRHTHCFEPILVGREHTWVYRGQITPSNRRVDVEVVVTEIQDGPTPTVAGSGFLKVDGIPIYEMKDFGVRLVPVWGKGPRKNK